MESSLVIKVNYGDTLRRFNARVIGNELNLDIAGLRAKILSLFNLSPDADLNLTYTDEDGDVVTLADDDDLRDVMGQRLNYLRIGVQLKNDEGANYARSTGNSTPLRSPRGLNPFPLVSDDVLKSVPEPVREAVTKLSIGLASKAASASPVVSEIVDCISKIGQFYITQSVEGADSGPQVVADSDLSSVFPNATTVGGTPGSSQEVHVATATPFVPVPSVDLNLDPPLDFNQSGSTVNLAPSSSNLPVEDVRENKEHDDHTRDKSALFVPSTKWEVNRWGRKSKCPFSVMPLKNGFHSVQLPIHPFNRRYNPEEVKSGVFHTGVQCDVCGIYPIAGPRFKSKVKGNYDLCSICFSEMGNEADYIRIDLPVTNRHPRPFKGLYDNNVWWSAPPAVPHILKGLGMKAGRPKLDSRFILDVTVVDGTVMAPSTPFTKIWRMRNNGDYVWPPGTKLVWIGGDIFTDVMSVELAIPGEGFPASKELDIVVDFRAPKLPGRYMSYWRMASSSGHKFGQRVWVLIQVDASLNDLISDRFQGLNLNLPPDSFYTTGPGDLNVPLPVVDDSEPQNSNAVMESVSEQPRQEQDLNFPINDALLVSNALGSSSAGNAPVSYPIIDFSEAAQAGPSLTPSWVSNGVENSSSPKASAISYPIIDFSEAIPAPAGPSTVPAPVVDATAPTDESDPVEQTLLKELEEMGFRQVDLNKEILRMNEYNLEQSLDDLCGVAEWDPILDELHEMGFCDTETNKMLLKKNNGSIKRVVMDLITGRNA